MNARRALPYILGLLVLAFALGSLPRGSPGGSLLFQSTWLLYLIYLGPIVVFGLFVAVIVFVAFNWRDIGAALGSAAARQRRMQKRRSRYSLFVSLLVWAIAVIVLIERPGTILNRSGLNQTIALPGHIIGGQGTPPNPFQGGFFFSGIASLVQNDWFGVALLGLLFVGGLVLAQTVRVALKETSEINIQELQIRKEEGLQAAEEAIMLVDDKTLDARSRIIACFHRMLAAVSALGIPIASDQTARELEKAIRSTFALKGDATGELTNLFEEARYSLHEIDDEDATHARQSLESIAQELKIHLTT